METLTTADTSALSTDQIAALSTVDVAALTTADTSALAAADVAPIKGKTKVRHQRQVKVVNTLTAVESTDTEVTDDEADSMPTSVKLAAPYAFYDEDGKLHGWAPGQIVEDAGEIALLVGRGAVFEA